MSALMGGCSSANNEVVGPTVSQPQKTLPSYELTSVGMPIDDAKEAIVGIGYKYFVAREDGQRKPGKHPVEDGMFLLDVEEGVVVHQEINGVFDYWDVAGLTQDEAESLITSAGFEHRVIVVDGQPLPTIPGRVVSRYNLSVTEGQVVGFMIEKVMLSEIWPPKE
jgi:hypothetical protein